VHGQPGIAHASQLEIRTRHPTGFKSRLVASGCEAAGMTALRKGYYRAQARAGPRLRSTRPSLKPR
jgi:hypothetical protein